MSSSASRHHSAPSSGRSSLKCTSCLQDSHGKIAREPNAVSEFKRTHPKPPGCNKCEVATHLATGIQYVRNARPDTSNRLIKKFLKEVTSIEYKDKYVYHITFDDGLNADVDFEPLLDCGPVFQPLRDIEFFRQAKIDGGTIAWPNGADVSPESLYEEVERANQTLQRSA